MNKKDYRLFTDSDIMDPLPPIYKGPYILFYPGQLSQSLNAKSGKFRSTENGSNPNRTIMSRLLGLRRYVFRYEGDNFVYLATRKGQRNGGFNSKPTQTRIQLQLAGPGFNVGRDFSFTEINDDNEEVWTESNFSIIKYNNLANRWEWLTRPVPSPSTAPPGPFFVNAYTQATTNPLKNTGSVDQIQWTYVSDPWDTATPEIPVTTAAIVSIVWYNNNSVDNLNKWPIRNVDADDEWGVRKKWQSYGEFENQGFLIPDRRPDCLSNEYLTKCFQNVNIKYYDIVFVEVMWRYFAHRNNNYDIRNKLNPIYWGYDENNGRVNIHDAEWWAPKPVKMRRQKGRVYRIGGLEADTGIGNFDKVLWAQRTRVITTDYRRGGETALE
jgi:hypothetical protein